MRQVNNGKIRGSPQALYTNIQMLTVNKYETNNDASSIFVPLQQYRVPRASDQLHEMMSWQNVFQLRQVNKIPYLNSHEGITCDQL